MNTVNNFVSVVMITYNHENFIREAIEGVLMQQASFSFELIIGEDCSTDNTRKICIEYKKKYPEIIRLLLPDSNLGMANNFLQTLNESTGKYIAICEGDDYWTDPYKLQKQVDILEKRNDLMAIVTNSSVCDLENNLIQKERLVIAPDNKQGEYNLHDFFKLGSQYPTLTVVFRNKKEYILNDLSNLSNPFLGDWILWVLLHNLGNFYFLNEVTGAYRINPNSVTHTVNAVSRWKADFKIRRQLIKITPLEYHCYLKDDTYAYHMIGMAYRKQKKIILFIYYELRSFTYNPILYLKMIKSILTL